jgi:hypothetical protein
MSCNGSDGTSGMIEPYSHLNGVSYELDHDQLLYQLLPKIYRKEKIYKYIRSVYNSLQSYWGIFLKDRTQLLREVRITGQTIILEAWLRDIFDDCSINIINASAIVDIEYIYKLGESGDVDDDVFIFRKDEIIPLVDNTYIFTRNEVIPEFDFIVEVPNVLINSGVTVREIEAIVDRYKYMGTTYQVVII